MDGSMPKKLKATSSTPSKEKLGGQLDAIDSSEVYDTPLKDDLKSMAHGCTDLFY
jgi:hypothetical protein